ncbi:MAG: periplasmic heavy metal sensor [Gemmatimonadota bacterium]
MKRLPIYLVALLALVLVSPLGAQQPTPTPGPGDDPLAKLLFPPELVLQHQGDIGLRPEQRTAITRAIGELQGKVLDIQWRMQEAATQLAALLGKSSVDQTAALAQVDQVLNLERDVKRAQLTLLILIKNTLTAEQQGKLDQYRRR